MRPGGWLRQLREELHLTRSAVERLTTEAASQCKDERYRIRRNRLTEIEEGRAVPDIFEVASLCDLYKVNYSTVLDAFGTNLRSNGSQITVGPADSNLQQWSFTDADRPFSLSFKSNINFDATRLVSESAEELGVPAIVRQRLDGGQYRLGIIGAKDDTMGELVPSGSVVVIDKARSKVEKGDWSSVRERPIYFVWHENGYSCSWCHLVQDTLFILPYPTSRQPVMIFKTPRAATVIGQVIHIWPPMITKREIA